MYEKLNKKKNFCVTFLLNRCAGINSHRRKGLARRPFLWKRKKKRIIIQRRRAEVVYYKGTADKRRKLIFKLTVECLADLNNNRDAGQHEILE